MTVPGVPGRVQQVAQRPLYRKPPVVEAVIDIRVELSGEPDFRTLSQIVAGEEDKYPLRDSLMSGRYSIEPASGLTSQATQELMGYRFVSATKQEVFQARRDAFAFSKLPPYTEWDEWQPEARRVWQRYRALMKPTRITRIAVRYVNRIEVPAKEAELSDYFETYPELPPSFTAIRNFIMRLEIPQDDLAGGCLVMSQGTLEKERPNSLLLLLDLDLFRQVNLESDDEIWEAITELHVRENAIFESCITDKSRELFNAGDL